MNASKENARKARQLASAIARAWDMYSGEETKTAARFILDFLTAAAKVLPAEASFDRPKKQPSKFLGALPRPKRGDVELPDPRVKE